MSSTTLITLPTTASAAAPSDASAVVADLFAAAGLDELFTEVLAEAQLQAQTLDSAHLDVAAPAAFSWICWKVTSASTPDTARAQLASLGRAA